MDLEKEFRENMERGVDEFFPKGISDDRGKGLMLYATAVLEHERIMCHVRKHMAYLLGEVRENHQSDDGFKSALEFYHAVTKSRHY